MIAGTSTGGLVTAMLTTPDEEGHPIFAAKDIKDFYLEHCPKIFPHARFVIYISHKTTCYFLFSIMAV